MGIPHSLVIRKQPIQPNCKICGKPCAINRQRSAKGFTTYRKHCGTCTKREYRRHIKDKCEFCGFIPVHICQLDIDHKDGDKKNNNPENLQTLCANCHRLKTQLSKDYLKKELR